MYYLLLALYFVSFGLIAYTLAMILWPYRSTLTEQIGFYEKTWSTAHTEIGVEKSELEGAGPMGRLKQYVIRWLGRRGPVDYLKQELERSGLSIEWPEFAFYHLLGAGSCSAFTYIIGGWMAAFIIVVLSAGAPILVIDLAATKRQREFAAQLPETLTMIAGSLKAGYSLLQAVDMVSKETTPPMSEEFKRVLADSRLGLPVEQALDKMSARVDNTNFEWMILAIKIQREVGGNLVEVLTTLSNTIRERETVARQIKVLTAEGRLSAIILLALPFFIGATLYVLNPSYMKVLFSNTAGIYMLAFSAVMMVIGAFWLRRVVKIEV